MTSIRWSRIVSSVFLLALGFVLGALSPFGSVSAQSAPRIYELRTYTAPDGKLGDLHARFRNHTLRIFQRLGMTNVIYLWPMDAPLKDNTLVYLLSYASAEERRRAGPHFGRFPDGKKADSNSQATHRLPRL